MNIEDSSHVWSDSSLLDDEVLFDAYMEKVCDNIIHYRLALSVIMLGCTDKAPLKLYESSVDENHVKSHESKDLLDFPFSLSGQGPHILHKADGLITAICQVILDELPVFVIYLEIAETETDRALGFLTVLTSHINLAFKFKEERRFSIIEEELLSEFFIASSNTAAVWKTFAENMVRFLPDYGHFTLDDSPLCQILTYTEGDRFLLMRASESGGFIGESKSISAAVPLKVDETVCGLVIEQSLEHLLVNPSTDYPERYQGYLYKEIVAKSELVVPVNSSDGQVIALLNFEHRLEKAFSDYDIKCTYRAAKFIEPLINAVNQAETRNRTKEISVLYVMSEILGRMSSIYRHKIENMMLKSRSVINSLEEKLADDEAILGDLALIRGFVGEFDSRSRSFLSELPSYLEYQKISLRNSFEQAIRDIDGKKLERDKVVNFELDFPDREFYVYASHMLKEHLYNLINNSVLAINQRIADGHQIFGKVDINIRQEKFTDTINKSFESSLSRIYVSISDNGGGLNLP